MKTSTDSDTARALEVLENHRVELSGGELLLITQTLGSGLTDYYRVFATYQELAPSETRVSNITWPVAVALGYPLRDRGGYWHIAISGGNFSKPYEIASRLASFYGIDQLNYEVL